MYLEEEYPDGEILSLCDQICECFLPFLIFNFVFNTGNNEVLPFISAW
jgi:hypothetical protein